MQGERRIEKLGSYFSRPSNVDTNVERRKWFQKCQLASKMEIFVKVLYLEGSLYYIIEVCRFKSLTLNSVFRFYLVTVDVCQNSLDQCFVSELINVLKGEGSVVYATLKDQLLL